ncbi:MAG TPA: hypothetical protein VFW94_07855 [Candidatus Acidoferrales bacterium]|nr:hypothetical protein [Candidatus Acidoferrales bacterium]
MSEVHVFGLNHFLQNIRAKCKTPAGQASEHEQKAALRATLDQIIRERSIDLIAEEAPVEPCIGRALADEHRIGYVDLTMPICEREKFGVRTPEYSLHPATQARAYEVFEDYFFRLTKSKRANIPLVICGRRHFRSLEKLFQGSGDTVRVYDIYDHDWYLGLPLEGADGLAGYHRYDD